MDENDRQLFRVKMRVSLIERLVLHMALSEGLSGETATIPASRRALEGWLDANGVRLAEFYTSNLDDAAEAVIFSEEAREVTETMKRVLTSVARD
jgi:hypothetical protein